jgi:hypothetical protein
VTPKKYEFLPTDSSFDTKTGTHFPGGLQACTRLIAVRKGTRNNSRFVSLGNSFRLTGNAIVRFSTQFHSRLSKPNAGEDRGECRNGCNESKEEQNKFHHGARRIYELEMKIRVGEARALLLFLVDDDSSRSG